MATMFNLIDFGTKIIVRASLTSCQNIRSEESPGAELWLGHPRCEVEIMRYKILNLYYSSEV